MISLLRLNKLILSVIFFTAITFNSSVAEEAEEAVDIWKQQQNQEQQNNQNKSDQDLTIESPILSDDVTKVVIKIDENQIEERDSSIIGIFDPEENNFNLNMWVKADGNEIKKVLAYLFSSKFFLYLLHQFATTYLN